MNDKDTALKIYCALLARDPLAQQRFQDISQRFAILATLACEAAEQFDAAHTRFQQPGARHKSAQVWDASAHSEVKGKADKAREAALISTARDGEHNLPKSQFDLVDEARGRQ